MLVFNLTSNIDAPGVHTTHLYGINKDTPTSFHYSSDNNFDVEPQVIHGNGDGIVPLKSLRSGKILWENDNNRKGFVEKTYNGESHLGILRSQQYIQDILRLLD